VHDLVPLTALGAAEARIDEFAGLTIREIPDIALASLAICHGKKAGFQRAVKKALASTLPAPGTSITTNDITLFWTGVDQWMVEAPFASHEDLAAHLSASLKGNASITEQNDGWARFDLEGPLCVDVLQRLSNADSAGMAAAAVTRTAIDHLGCFLICRTAGQHFSILCPRSGAASLHHAVIAAVHSAL
jgi:sarcosine oxidase, subunit gamma